MLFVCISLLHCVKQQQQPYPCLDCNENWHFVGLQEDTAKVARACLPSLGEGSYLLRLVITSLCTWMSEASKPPLPQAFYQIFHRYLQLILMAITLSRTEAALHSADPCNDGTVIPKELVSVSFGESLYIDSGFVVWIYQQLVLMGPCGIIYRLRDFLIVLHMLYASCAASCHGIQFLLRFGTVFSKK